MKECLGISSRQKKRKVRAKGEDYLRLFRLAQRPSCLIRCLLGLRTSPQVPSNHHATILHSDHHLQPPHADSSWSAACGPRLHRTHPACEHVFLFGGDIDSSRNRLFNHLLCLRMFQGCLKQYAAVSGSMKNKGFLLNPVNATLMNV